MATARKTPTPPIASEALAESIPFDFEGLALSVAPSSQWSIRALDRFERGFVTTFLEHVLDAPSYKAILDADLKPDAIGRLVPVIQKAAGVAGN